ESFARPNKSYGMFSDIVAFANRFDWDVDLEFCFQNLTERFRRPARRIFFLGVMRFHDFGLKLATKNFRGATSQREERIHSNAEVRSKDDRQRFRSLLDELSLFRRMSCCSDDERFLFL